MNGIELRAWIDQQSREFKRGMEWRNNESAARFKKCCAGEIAIETYLDARRTIRAFVMGGLYVVGRDIKPDVLNEYLDELERGV